MSASRSEHRLRLARYCLVAAAISLQLSMALFQLLMLLGIALWASGEQWPSVCSRLRGNTVVLLALALWLFILLSAVWAAHPSVALSEAWKYRKLLWVVPLALLFDTDLRRKNLVVALSAGWMLCLLVGLIGHATLWASAPLPTALYRPGMGVLGTNYIQLGVTQLTLAFALLAWSRTQTGRISWLLYLGAAVSIADALFMWNGRLALISFFVLILSGWLVWRPRIATTGVAICLSMITVWIALNHSTAWNTRSPLRQLNESAQSHNRPNSTTLRLSYWRCAIDIWRDHPILGAGAGSGRTEQTRSCRFDNAEYAEYARGSTAHQQYLQFLAETGPIGLALFIALVASSLRAAWQHRHSPTNQVLLVLLACLAAGSLFNSFLRDAGQGHLWAFALALAARLRSAT